MPDFRLHLPTPSGPSDSLAELKICGASNCWYPRGKDGRGTDNRAGGLPKLYRDSLLKYDRRFYNTQPGETGPLVERLQSFGDLWGLVVGPWGDSSHDMHQLIKVLAQQRVAYRDKSRGTISEPDHLSVVIGQIRRVLSCTFVRAQGLCLLQRLTQLAPGARGAAERRAGAKRQEAVRRLELVSQWQAQVRGRGLNRVGMIFTP